MDYEKNTGVFYLAAVIIVLALVSLLQPAPVHSDQSQEQSLNE